MILNHVGDLMKRLDELRNLFKNSKAPMEIFSQYSIQIMK